MSSFGLIDDDGFLRAAGGLAVREDCPPEGCGCDGGCPECADPVKPNDQFCDPLPVPVDFYRGSSNPYTETAVQYTHRRWGRVVFSYSWNGLVAEGDFTYDKTDVVQVLPDPRNVCRMDVVRVNPVTFEYPVYNYGDFVGNGLCTVGNILFTGGGAEYPPIDNNFRFPDDWGFYGSGAMHLGRKGYSLGHTVLAGLTHGISNQTRSFLSRPTRTGFPADDFDISTVSVNVGGRSFGAAVCSIKLCTRARFEHQDASHGFFRYSTRQEVAASASCLISRSGSAERVIGDGRCRALSSDTPGDAGDPAIGGGQGPTDNDRRVADFMGQDPLAGCVGCG